MSVVFDNPAEPEIVLDLSRLLSRIAHSTPTGVDRCEMAYARGLLAEVPERLRFAAVHPTGFYGRLQTKAALRFLDLTEERWASRGFKTIWERRRFVAGAVAALRPRLARPDPTARRIFVQASPNNLTRPRLVQRILAHEQARYLCLVHDLIPLEFPEYGRADGVQKHRTRMETIAAYADGIVTNSHATMASLKPWLDVANSRAICAVAHLGTHIPAAAPQPAKAAERPYFVCVGTIEPRKNHLLLLNIWRRLAEQMGSDAVPKLILIGRRGWENEQVVDMLERCTALKNCVEEHNMMSDAAVASVVANARALLLPSFAEGYGMPVTEALSLNVPVVCSDLPALREAGGNVPEFLDPLDGPGWSALVIDFAIEHSARRQQQLTRLAGWSPPSWNEHIRIVLDLSVRLAQ